MTLLLSTTLNSYDWILRTHPHVSVAYYSRGVAYDEKSDVDRAIEDYTLALEYNSNFADAYHNRGYAYYKKSEFTRATEDYNRAIQLKPDNVLYYNNRSMALLHLHEWEKAKEDLTIAKNMGENIITLFHFWYLFFKPTWFQRSTSNFRWIREDIRAK